MPIEQPTQTTQSAGLSVERYKRRNWAVRTPSGELLVVAVYRKGANAVVAHITALTEQLCRANTGEQ